MGKYEMFSKRLKELRNSLGLTQKEFSQKIGCTQTTLSAYENKHNKQPNIDIVVEISKKCK